MSRSMSAVPHKDPHGRRRPVGWHRTAALEPKHLEMHTQLISKGKPMSGRIGGYVYWWRNGRQHWRRHVIPADPRNPVQRRSRAAFRAAAIAWSQNQPLTEEQRDDWYAAAAKIKCRPRLGTWGFRTAQQHFVGNNSLKERWGLPLLLEPPARETMTAERRMRNAKAAPQVSQPRALNPTSWDPRRACTRPPPGRHQGPKGHTGRRNALRVAIQAKHCQALTRDSSERPRPFTVPPPVQRRRPGCSATRLGIIAAAERPFYILNASFFLR
jgi:hypothetical protein